MSTFTWQDGVKEKIDAMCAIFPDIIRNRWKDRLIYNAEKIAAYGGESRVTESIMWQSVAEIFPGGFDPLVLKVKDPEKLKADMLASRSQEDLAPGAEPVTITRWAQDTDGAADVPRGKKVLAVCASARKGGNTDVIIDELLRAAQDNGSETEKIYLSDLNMKQCSGCRVCRKQDVKTICAIKDDMQSFYEKLYTCNGLISGFPIYTARENGYMATFMDRWDCFQNPYLTRKMPPGKKGIIVCTWMWPNPKAYDDIVEKMVILMRLHQVMTTDVLVITGTRGKKHGKGVVKNHPDIMDTTYRAGVQFLKGLQ